MTASSLRNSILALTLSALIAGVESQATCNSDCCWVVQSYEFMGKAIPNGIATTDNSCCTGQMTGVTCDSTNTKVIEISWGSRNLSGSIPDSIGNLGSLKNLRLGNNQLSGPIPTSIGNLGNLQNLWLGNNQLSGPIPTSIGNLGSLQNLGISNNQLSGPIPASIGNLVNLQNLWLGNNQLSGPIPTSIGNLGSLQNLGISNNQLSGPIPASIGNLGSLQNLGLSNNKLSGPIPTSIGNLRSLQNLWLGNNQLSGSIPASIGNLGSLKNLGFRQNNLSGLIPAEIGILPSLNFISLYQNPGLTGTFTPRCSVSVAAGNDMDAAANKGVKICGCANEVSPVGYFASSNTPIECLATGVVSPSVKKRAPVLLYTSNGFLFTCNTNSTTLRPYQDCINLIGAYCLTTTPVFTSWNDCHTKVLSVRDKLNSNWKSYINSCASFVTGGDPTSQRCNDATNQILTNEYYVMSDGTNVNVPLSVVRGAAYIWST